MTLHFHSGYAYQEVLESKVDQTPTILIHGAGSSHLGWPSAIRHLSGKHILSIDLPNHGKSAQKELQSIEQYADNLHSFLNGLGIQHANLIGHSMGAALVLQLILQYPELCVRGALFAYTPAPVFKELFSEAGDHDKNQPEWIQTFTERLFSPGFPIAQREKISSPLFFKDSETLRSDLLITQQYQPALPVGKISIPFLLLYGEDDPFLNQSQKQILIKKFINPMVKEIPRAGHLFLWEHTEIVQKYLVEFLDNA